MNFCGVRIKTEPAEGQKTEKLVHLEPQKGMWACEKQAIKTNNEQVVLQNKKVALSKLKTLDMSFLGKLDKDRNPKFGVFPITSFYCALNIKLYQCKFSNLSCSLPKVIGDGYRSGLKDKKLSENSRSYQLEANFVGLVPQKIKDKAEALQNAGARVYLIAETSWEKRELPKPDPLLIAVNNGKVYLAGVFDASIEENYVAHEFATDAEE